MAALVRHYRRAIWSYLESRLSVGVQDRYAAARSRFADWCVERGFDSDELSPHDLDAVLGRFILEALEDEEAGWGRQAFLDLAAALQRRHAERLKLSWELLGEWGWLAPPQQAASLPAEAAYAAAVALVARFQRPAEGLHTLLCFCGLLRAGESLALRRSDVHVPCSSKGP